MRYSLLMRMRELSRRGVLQLAAASAFAAETGLVSRRGEVRPVSTEERLRRMERARALMRVEKLDAILLAGGSSLSYFSGVRWGNSERLLLMVLPAKGDPFFVSPAFEEDRALEQITAGLSQRQQVFTWQEDESPYELVASSLKERGLATGRIGIEETVKFVFADGIAKAAPRATVSSATRVTAGCRSVKSVAELALMKLANEVTSAAYRQAWSQVRPGMTAQEISSLIAAAHTQLGFPGYAMVLIDDAAALPHGSSKPHRILEGSLVLLDGGCSVEGYQSDISRTFVIGKPSEKMKRVYDAVQAAQSKVLASVRPGMECGAVDAVARKVIGDAGFGSGYSALTHRVGHGIGLDGHEWPYLVKGNKQQLEAGMTFSDEPGIYLRGEFGVRLEDCFHVTEGGAEMFTKPSSSLEKPWA